MKTKHILDVLEAMAVVHEQNGQIDKATMLRAFAESLSPLSKLDATTVIDVLRCEQAVDTKRG